MADQIPGDLVNQSAKDLAGLSSMQRSNCDHPHLLRFESVMVGMADNMALDVRLRWSDVQDLGRLPDGQDSFKWHVVDFNV